MGVDSELTGILREVVQFLKCLRDVKLPDDLESIRDYLLIRAKDALGSIKVDSSGRSVSPESYLSMNAGGSKGLVAISKAEAELSEYVGPKEQQVVAKQQQQQDYYETFQSVQSACNAASASAAAPTPAPTPAPTLALATNKDEEIENACVNIYSNFSVARTRSECQKCGPLERKEGKKLFVSKQYRACWVGLVKSHLLIYGSDKDNRPCMVQSIRGYMARPAPNAVPRKSGSAFEVFCPGSKTLQFIARTPNDMEQWVAKISEFGGEDKNEQKEARKAVSSASGENDGSQTDVREDSNYREERYQDVGSLVNNKLPDEATTVPAISNEDDESDGDSKDAHAEIANTPLLLLLPPPPPPPPPPLPARIPRRLPSLPVTDSTASDELPDEEEDEIYYKIEDFRDTGLYRNVRKAIGARTGDAAGQPKELETYDDVHATTKDESKSEEKRKRKNFDRIQNEATYDDAAGAVQKDNAIVVIQQEESLSYDDVENLISSARSTKHRATERTEESSKSPQKKSFLDRVRSRRESPRKVEKKTKGKPSTTPPIVSSPELPIYDDVFALTTNGQEVKCVEEETEYTCPPPPRPVYVKPPTVTDATEQQEFYDDVSAYRELCKDKGTCKMDQQSPQKLNQIHGAARSDIDNSTAVCENIDSSKRSIADVEHYQTPRNELCHRPVDQQEELYDDIALLADFTARQKEFFSRKDSEDAARTQTGFEKKSWNRFVSGRKPKLVDPIERNSRVPNETEDEEDLAEQHSVMRMNTFQKLISKMENSLSKTSVKASPSMLLNKSNMTSNAQYS